MQSGLWHHQEVAIQRALERKSFGIFFDMGCGKTRTAIEIVARSGSKSILVVCPVAVRNVWFREFTQWWPLDANQPPDYPILHGPNGSGRRIRKSISQWWPTGDRRSVFVLNYEAVWRAGLAEEILSRSWDCVIADEVHRIKSPTGRASKFMYELSKRAKIRLGLSGTPMPHSPSDIFGVMRFIDVTAFGEYVTPFRRRYEIRVPVEGAPSPHITKCIGYVNKAEMEAKIAERSMVVKSEDVQDLPEQIDVWHECELGVKAAAVYRSLDKELCAEVDEGIVTAANALVKLLRLQQVTSGHITDEAGELKIIDGAKAELCAELLEDIGFEPVVVFCRFTQDLAAVREAAIAAGRYYFEMSGRENTLELWKSCDAAPILGVQIQSGGEGEDFTKARHAIYFSVGYSLREYLQSRKRTHRPGQSRKCLYHHLVCTGTKDEEVYAALKERREVVDAVLQGIQNREKAHVTNDR